MPGSKPGEPDEATRRQVTGKYPDHSTAVPIESPELRAMREIDRELFPPGRAPSGAPWSTSLAVPEGPAVDVSGLPATGSLDIPAERKTEKRDLSWLSTLKLPDIPVRFERSVVAYLTYYKDTEKGRSMVASWIKKSGRYRDSVVKLLKQYKLPEDILWLALVESAFDPSIHSHAGAAGLWQFMPATARIYGLTVTKRVDERLDPERSTHAALKHLKDLHQRFGTWDLAFAAYNMGYGGLLASVRKYNTNDYWELRRLEAGLPYETALYVPKIQAMAIVARNCKVFGCDTLQLDNAEPFGDDQADKVSVAPGVTLEDVAKASGEKLSTIVALNGHVIASRMPPLEHAAVPRKAWTVYVPEGAGKKAQKELPSYTAARKLGTHRVRWGEPLERLALAYGVSVADLEKLNDLHPHEPMRPGSIIFVPSDRRAKSPVELAQSGEPLPVAVVPDHQFRYIDRRRVFYEAVLGDTVEDVARIGSVTADNVRRWNHLDRNARLQEGMRLLLYVPKHVKSGEALLLEDAEVHAVTVGSDAFHQHFVGGEGRRRIEVTAVEGDTWKKLSEKYGLSQNWLERINHKSRKSKLEAGDKVVVYARTALLQPSKPPVAAPEEEVKTPAGVPSDPASEPPKDAPQQESRVLDRAPGNQQGEQQGGASSSAR
ncbi:MAG TPA: transglycosylase SLT domain-containing protein [Polyangiaceae bacterium]|nr:transglycosylase SLT domain-containing protein [Polyangiaceae bacterium]